MTDAAEKQFMYKVRAKRLAMMYQGPNEQEAAILEEHYQYLKGLAAHGVLIMAGRTLNADESAFGVVIFKAESEEAARAIVYADPAVKRNVLGVQLFPFHVAVTGGAVAAA
jgi:uncharacterized protein YciI